MTFYGELSSEEIEEIKEITNCQKVEKIIEETDFKPYIFYKFQFNFKKYWNINYQH